MNTVRVETPCRLHFGLIDLNGELGRIDGSIGLTLDRPRFVLTATRSDALEVVGAGPHRPRVCELAERLMNRWNVGAARLEFSETIPPHSGLGSGTQATLSVIHAIAELYDLDLTREEAIRLSGRGGASGIGVYAFYEGGFLVDGGHRFPDRKSSYLPSAASSESGVGPLLLRRDFPDWDILLVAPEGSHISGDKEAELFQSLCPMPHAAAQRACHLLVMGMLPALAERDMRAFARAADALQQVGWKKVEIDVQKPVVRKTAERLRESGAHGVAMSSWGPALAVFTDDPISLKRAADEFLASLDNDGLTFITQANNVGARIEVDEPA